MCTVNSHNCDAQQFKLRVSNLRTVTYVHFNLPFESSNLPGAGPIFQIAFLKTGCRSRFDRFDFDMVRYVSLSPKGGSEKGNPEKESLLSDLLVT